MVPKACSYQVYTYHSGKTRWILNNGGGREEREWKGRVMMGLHLGKDGREDWEVMKCYAFFSLLMASVLCITVFWYWFLCITVFWSWFLCLQLYLLLIAHHIYRCFPYFILASHLCDRKWSYVMTVLAALPSAPWCQPSWAYALWTSGHHSSACTPSVRCAAPVEWVRRLRSTRWDDRVIHRHSHTQTCLDHGTVGVIIIECTRWTLK